MPSKYFQEALSEVPCSTKIFTEKSLDIIDRVHQLLEQKQMTKEELGKRLNKSEVKIEEMLSAGHDITLKSICELEVVLGEGILKITI